MIRVRDGRVTDEVDDVAIERPLQIRLCLGNDERVLTTTMRTPGHDVALAVGFLFAERVLSGNDLAALEEVDSPSEDVVRVHIRSPHEIEHAEAALRGGAERQFVTSAACGVCGRDNVTDLMEVGTVGRGELDASDARPVEMAAAVLQTLPQRLRDRQSTFSRTGGLHAAGAFTLDGLALSVFEDVGRHNAVDKVVGTCLREGRVPMSRAALMVSGRASFELAQKAARAGFPILAAVGAPSSLAIEIARAASMTLLGFVRAGGFNIYTSPHRLRL